jgi:magnesium-transporting ATPase (P-type)
MNKFKKNIREHPEVRTGIFVFSVIISGILCSAFVTEISLNGKLIWKDFYKAYTFWGLIVYSIIIYLYNRFIYQFEKNILNFLDDDYCKAYIVQSCLPDLIEKYKTDLKSGKESGKLIDISKECESRVETR